MKKIFRVVVFISLPIYILALIYILFFRYRYGLGIEFGSFAERIQYATNFVPFRTIGTFLTRLFEGSINTSIVVENLLGNLLLFFLLGFYLPFLFKKFSRLSVYAMWVALVIVAVEIVQFIIQMGSLDVDDFILNFSGAILGWLIFTKTPLKKLLDN